MALATRFEGLEAWQAARRLTSEVYSIARAPAFRRDFALSDQVRRAAVSTMNNLAEGFDSGSRNEFQRFVRYAARSASGVQSCLYVALDQGYVERPVFERLYREARSVRRLCFALVRALARGPRSEEGSGEVREPPPPCWTLKPFTAFTGHRSPVTDHQSSSSGHRSPVTGHRSLSPAPSR